MKDTETQTSIISKRGFTLLELLIVIAIIAILSVILILVLNPAETLAKSRDSQRISDLATVKTAIGTYMTTKSNPQLDGMSGAVNDKCDGGTGANEKLWVSVAVGDTLGGGETITDATPPTGWPQFVTSWVQSASSSTQPLVDGTGWIPVKLDAITGGAPISNMPIDPINDLSITTGSDASTAAAVNWGAQMYRYACKKVPLGFEMDARLESVAYGVGGDDDKAAKDGGNNPKLYEVGTDLTILPDATVNNEF